MRPKAAAHVRCKMRTGAVRPHEYSQHCKAEGSAQFWLCPSEVGNALGDPAVDCMHILPAPLACYAASRYLTGIKVCA